MRSKFTSGMITGSIIGAAMGMVAYGRMTPRQKKSLMKNSSKMVKNATELMDDIHILKILK